MLFRQHPQVEALLLNNRLITRNEHWLASCRQSAVVIAPGVINSTVFGRGSEIYILVLGSHSSEVPREVADLFRSKSATLCVNGIMDLPALDAIDTKESLVRSYFDLGFFALSDHQ